MGSYHGRHSFDTFSHRKSVCRKALSFDADIRYPPYTPKKQSITRSLMRGDYWGLLMSLLGYRKGL
jgi:aldehyde dehydrogenase (NAD+)